MNKLMKTSKTLRGKLALLAGIVCASLALHGAWYDAPKIKTTVNIRGDYPSNLMTFMNMSADGQYLMVPLHAENDSYPVQVYSVATLTGTTSNWLSPAQAGAKNVFATGTYGTKWKGGAISSAGMVMGSGQSSGVTFPFLALPADSWTKDVNAFACTGFETAGSDGMDFSADGKLLYCNSSTNKAIIMEYDSSALATSHAVTYKRTITTAATRVRNLSCYTIGGKTLVYFGEGAVSTGAKSVYVWDTTTAAPTVLLTNSDIAGDITNVKVSGIFRGQPRLYVLTDAGQLLVYALKADGMSLAFSSPIKSFTASEVSALCGINVTVITSGFKNFEVTDNGRFAFFAHHAEGNISAPGICVVHTENDTAIPAIEGDENVVTTVVGKRTIITVPADAKVRVNRSCKAELLIVGGGGGGGGPQSGTDANRRGGGGGAGGVIHTNSFVLAAGDYAITIGKGGVLHNNWSATASGAMGGDTTAFGFTAKGGGYGAMAYAASGAQDGASGGGSSKNGSGTISYTGKAKYAGSPYFNLGHNGADAVSVYNGGGGGGGAGSAANGIYGGDGYACSITGSEVYYAGGGGGYTDDTNGKGGGNACYGGGGRQNRTGGNGVVIISFDNGCKDAFDDATGGTVKKGRDENGAFITHTFSSDGIFTLPHAGLVELLIVGGGGGGGGIASVDKSDASIRSGGGGGGGVIHKQEFFLPAGEYDVCIGKGGILHNNWQVTAPDAMGGDTTAFGLTAKGGGYGAMGNNRSGASDGASGGGGSKDGSGNISYSGKAVYTGSPYYNLGNAAGTPQGKYSGGGGGGGAGSAANGIQGGDGYACSITGSEVYYAGGGGGNLDGTNGKGGGNACYGGGGRQNRTGGNGVVIVRYARPTMGLTIIIR